jgi:hypothetical protein
VFGAARKDIAARLIWKAMVRYLARFDNARARTSHLYDISAGPVPQAVTQLHTQRWRRRMTAMRAGECALRRQKKQANSHKALRAETISDTLRCGDGFTPRPKTVIDLKKIEKP